MTAEDYRLVQRLGASIAGTIVCNGHRPRQRRVKGEGGDGNFLRRRKVDHVNTLRALEGQAEQNVKDMQSLLERAEGRYIQNTQEVERAITLWQGVRAFRVAVSEEAAPLGSYAGQEISSLERRISALSEACKIAVIAHDSAGCATEKCWFPRDLVKVALEANGVGARK